MEASLDTWLKEAVGADAHKALLARKHAREAIGLDAANWAYFFCLYQKTARSSQSAPLRIHEDGKDRAGERIAYPVSIAPPEMLKALSLVDYAGIKKSPEHYDQAGREVALWIKKMNAGTGTSFARTRYLSRRRNIPESEVKVGAKGTDLFVELPNARDVSIAETGMLQCLSAQGRGEFGEVIFHDIVSGETVNAIDDLWAKRSVVDPSRSYRELVTSVKGLGYSGASHQAFIPTLDEKGQFSFNRKAPGGHALFAVEALLAACREDLRPRVKGTLIAAIGNGEDLNSSPDAFMLGYMRKKRAPIVLVTTERTSIDAKGGLLSLVKGEEGEISLTVLETAQATSAGQGDLFASLPGIVSTNLTLFNYDALVPLITKEVSEIGEDEFLRVIAPDLIRNPKSQKDPDGVTRTYIQLEGTMGSTIMNLDRYWRKKYGTALVHLINVDRMNRTDFFTPVKTAFDFFMLYHSDRFSLDPETFRLMNRRPGELPRVSLSDNVKGGKFYDDVENVLEVFHGAHIQALDELTVEGRVGAQGIDLRGKVRLAPSSPKNP